MDMTITQQANNALLQRTEIAGTISFNGPTPSNKEVTEEIAKKTKKESSLIVMKNLYTSFGHQEAKFSAVAYDSAEKKESTEKLTKHMKKKIEDNKKKVAEEKKSQEEAAAKQETEKKEEKAPVVEKEEPKEEKSEPEKKEGEA